MSRAWRAPPRILHRARPSALRGIVQASDGGTYGVEDGHTKGPEYVGAARRMRINPDRSVTGWSCCNRGIFLLCTNSPKRPAIDMKFAPWDTTNVRETSITERSCAAAAYPRRCADFPQKLATCLWEYEDMPWQTSSYQCECSNRMQRLAIYKQNCAYIRATPNHNDRHPIRHKEDT
jgi:hypothetical protein